jgi:phage FluMu gp28-like protein
VRVEEFAFHPRSVGRLASTLLMLVREHALDLPDDTELLDELVNLRLRETSPGVLRLDHDPDRHDDRAVALALAASALVERPIVGNLHASVGAVGLPLREVLAGTREGLYDGSGRIDIGLAYDLPL